MTHSLRFPLHLFAVILLASPLSALAQQAPSPSLPRVQEGEQERSPPPPRRSLSDAVRRVERDTRGEVLSAERVQYDGRDMHRVKVVDDQGRVREFIQDPSRSGRQQLRPKRGNDD